MKKLFITIITCLFLLIGSNAFGANLNGSIDGTQGGQVIFKGSYNIVSISNENWSEKITYNYHNFSYIPGIVINGQLKYKYNSTRSERKIKGTTTLTCNNTVYTISMDVTARNYRKPTGYFHINGINCPLNEDLINAIEVVYFDQQNLLIF